MKNVFSIISRCLKPNYVFLWKSKSKGLKHEEKNPKNLKNIKMSSKKKGLSDLL